MALSRAEAEQRHAQRQKRHPSFNQLPDMLSAYDVANYLETPVQVVIALIKRGHLAGGKYPGRRGYYITRNALYDHLVELTQFELSEEYDIIDAPTMGHSESNPGRESVPPDTGSAEVAPSPESRPLPFSADTPADKIGRLAVTTVAEVRAEREELEEYARGLRNYEQQVVLAAKELGGFSWSALAQRFGMTKSSFVSIYDPKTIAGKRRWAGEQIRQQRIDAAETRNRRDVELRQRLPGPDAETPKRQAS